MAATLFPVLLLLLVSVEELQGGGKGRAAAVVGSKHDLSVVPAKLSGASQGGASCSFCHTPHGARRKDGEIAPLWNREISVATYNTYISPTYDAGAATPSQGVSKLCLSCHDGTIASGQALGSALLGTDLSNDHPVAIQPKDDRQLAASLFREPPATEDPDVELVAGRIECTTCHNAHDPAVDPVEQKFLVRSNSGGLLCLACHDPSRPQPNHLGGWRLSAHATATHTVAQTTEFGPYGSVEANACGNCHRSHGAPGTGVPIQRGVEEETCSPCHDGKGVSPDIPDVMSDFAKTYSHPTILQTGIHEPTEKAFPLAGDRHAECVDCHQPHSTQNGRVSSSPPAVQAALIGVSGFDGTSALRPAKNEYEVCFKCHADSGNKPQNSSAYTVYGHTALREVEQKVTDPKNLREKFASSTGRHNVTQPRRLSATEVPSLRPFILNRDGSDGRSLAVGTYIYCSDCHTSEAAVRTGGNGANGPHGSIYTHILAARYEQEIPPAVPGRGQGRGIPYVPGQGGSYALCSMCHDIESSILADLGFAEHREHIVGEDTSCATCHDPHGIHDPGGTLTNNHRMVSFDLSVVGPDEGGRLYFDSVNRECYLSCHGVDHGPKRY